MASLYSNKNHNGTGQPWMIYTLMGLNTLFYVLQVVNATKKQLSNDEIVESRNGPVNGPVNGHKSENGKLRRLASAVSIENMALVPKQLFEMPMKELPTTLFSMFSHGNFTHLLFNMLALYQFGRPIEHTMGAFKTLLIYMVSGIGANLLYSVFNSKSNRGLIGASGAISGLSAAYFLHFAEKKNMTTWLMFQLAGLLLAQQSGISYSSHLLGFGIGAATYYALVNFLPKSLDKNGERQ